MSISFSKILAQVCSHGAGKSIGEKISQCASLLSAYACVISANILLAKQVTWFSPALKGKANQPGHSYMAKDVDIGRSGKLDYHCYHTQVVH